MKHQYTPYHGGLEYPIEWLYFGAAERMNPNSPPVFRRRGIGQQCQHPTDKSIKRVPTKYQKSIKTVSPKKNQTKCVPVPSVISNTLAQNAASVISTALAKNAPSVIL